MPRAIETRTLTLELDGPTVDLLRLELDEAAERRRRVGLTLSGELADRKRAGEDIRTDAVKVVGVLAEADALQEAAALIGDAWDTGKAKTVRRKTTGGKRAAEPSPPTSTDGTEDGVHADGLFIVNTDAGEVWQAWAGGVMLVEDADHDVAQDALDERPFEEPAAVTGADGVTSIEHGDDPDVAALLAAGTPAMPPA